mmetsp:Transcript_13102/g.41813  ORF Transcript_13102/g.41813 Transcript_13102/m.41813 type:complete len:510 (-) Transcript_13102:244-1773(-)
MHMTASSTSSHMQPCAAEPASQSYALRRRAGRLAVACWQAPCARADPEPAPTVRQMRPFAWRTVEAASRATRATRQAQQVERRQQRQQRQAAWLTADRRWQQQTTRALATMGGSDSKKAAAKRVPVDAKHACPFIQENEGDLLEYSVVYTDRAINLMSAPFQEKMRDISKILKEVYHAKATAIIPGSGTYAMEAVARQFGTKKNCLVIRNGFFSFRWSDIFAVCDIPAEETVLKARVQNHSKTRPPMAPVPVEEVIKTIEEKKPDVVFAPHVETATGIILPDDYIKQVAEATHAAGGIFVLDAIAAGTLWANMEDLGVDVLVTAPQKGWSGPACCGIVLMNDKAVELTKSSQSTSFSCNLGKWLEVMEKYEAGGFMYYTTLPTDALTAFHKVMIETRDELGFKKAEESARELGSLVRGTMAKFGLDSVAAEGFQAPTVVVCYSDSPDMVAKFKQEGLQIAGGVPFKCDEPEGLITFRIGLFGIDKLRNPKHCAKIFEDKLTSIMEAKNA